MTSLGGLIVMSCAPSATPDPSVVPLSFANGARDSRPFPSDSATTPDPGTNTGLRLDLGPRGSNFGAIDDGLFLLGEAPLRAARQHDGWSVLGPLLLPFALEPDLSSSRDHIVLIDVSTGMAHPLELSLVEGESGLMVRATPIGPLKEASRYVLAVLSGLVSADGRRFIRPDGFRPSAAADTALTRAGFLEPAILWSTELTTQSVTHELTQQIEAMKQAAPPTIEVQSKSVEGDYVRFSLRLTTPQEAKPLSILLYTPKGPGPFPVVTYQHGFFSDKSSVQVVRDELIAMGVAVLSTDLPLHGDRVEEGKTEADFFDLGRPSELASNIQRAVLDHIALASAIDATTEEIPLDPSRRAYLSVSLGSIVGALLLAHDPSYGAAVLVAGGGCLSLVARQLLSRYSSSGIDAEAASALVQILLDRADPASSMTTREHQPQILLIQGIRDRVIPASATLALARAFELVAIDPIEQMPRDIVVARSGVLSGGWTQFDGDHGLLESERNGDARKRARQQLFHFLKTYFQSKTGEIRAGSAS